jgi:hypothetical protein
MDSDWRRAFDTGDDAGAPPSTEEGDERAGVFSRLRQGLSRSREALTAELSASFTDQIDESPGSGSRRR